MYITEADVINALEYAISQVSPKELHEKGGLIAAMIVFRLAHEDLKTSAMEASCMAVNIVQIYE